MNNTTLTGRITKDIELKETNGTMYCNFTLAVNRVAKKEGQPTTDFISCVAFGKIAELMNKYLSQGSKILVTGEIRTGSYKNKEGNTVYTTNVVINNLEFLESKKDVKNELPFM